MSLRAKTLHYSKFQNQKTFLMKAKWNYYTVVDVNNIVLIAKCFIFLHMAAKRSNSDRSLKMKYEVLQEIEKGV